MAVAICTHVPVFTLTPQFIKGTRTLYVREILGSRGDEIVTGFGLSILSRRGCYWCGTPIVFADVRQDENSEPMGGRRVWSAAGGRSCQDYFLALTPAGSRNRCRIGQLYAENFK